MYANYAWIDEWKQKAGKANERNSDRTEMTRRSQCNKKCHIYLYNVDYYYHNVSSVSTIRDINTTLILNNNQVCVVDGIDLLVNATSPSSMTCRVFSDSHEAL